MLTDAKVTALRAPSSGPQEHPDTKVTGLRLRVGSGGTKTWIFRARAGGRTINKKLGTYPGMKLADAREAALKAVEAVARSGSAEVLERTFGALAQHWIKHVAKPKNDSWKNQERALERHVLPRWRDRKVADIRRAEVRDLVEGLEVKVLPNRVLTLVKTIFRFALSRDWIDYSPAEGIGKPRVERSRDRVLTVADVAAIWKAAEHLGYPFGPYIRLLCLAGQRRTEVASMRWLDVDLDTANWTIPAALTKSERKHAVPLSPLAVATLESLPRLGEYVFTTDGRTHMSNFAKIKGRLDTYLAAAGMTLEPWRLHDLRRSAATHMVRLGIREEVVGRVLNHAATGITARVYALHSYAPEKREALNTWAAELERITTAEACSVKAGQLQQ
jgi:integrase